MIGPQAKDTWSHQKLEEAVNEALPVFSSDFCPLQPPENCLNQPVSAALLQQLKQIRTTLAAKGQSPRVRGVSHASGLKNECMACAVLGREPRGLCVLGKASTVKLYS